MTFNKKAFVRDKFILIALFFSVPLLVLQLFFDVRVTAEQEGIPLLTVLLMNEFGFVLCAAGVWSAVAAMKRTAVQAILLAGVFVAVAFAGIFIWRLLLLYPTGS